MDVAGGRTERGLEGEHNTRDGDGVSIGRLYGQGQDSRIREVVAVEDVPPEEVGDNAARVDAVAKDGRASCLLELQLPHEVSTHDRGATCLWCVNGIELGVSRNEKLRHGIGVHRSIVARGTADVAVVQR